MDYEQLEHIKRKLENPKLPYKISNTHFKVGAKLHSEDFYYAKPLFQSSSDIKDIAEIIVDKIKKKFQIKKDEKILLIGYEMYSELLLSLVCKLLNKEGYNDNDIKHFVGIDNEGVFSFKPNEKEDMFWLNDEEPDKGLLKKCTAIIIVPIASTGNTAVKIKEAVIKEAEKVVKITLKPKYEKLGKSDKELKNAIEGQSKLIEFSYNTDKDYVINVIAAQDKDKIKTDSEIKKLVKTNNERQECLIELNATWYLPEKCKLCGLGDEGFSESEPLFGTDKSYLTPALIFDYPKGKTINDKDNSGILFDNVVFDKSLKYRRIKRNNEFFLFSINSPTFIKENNKENSPNINKWLDELHNEFYNLTYNEKLKINDVDNIIILAPCHETNSEFLNLVNELVFNSKATIIYHQPNVDYIENFKLLNKKKLDEAKKVFYVDDNLISGSSFFDIYHLFRDTAEEENDGEKGKKELTGAILLRDSSTQEMHDRFLRAVKQCRAFVSYNLPPSLSFDNKKPLEHERKRFADLRQFALHDVLIKIFDEKEQELNVDRDKGDKKRRREHIEIPPKEQEKHDEEKKSYYINMFKTTHKVFEYFKQQGIKKEDKFSVDDLLINCYGNNNTDNKITLLKVLSQYPSILYKPIKEQAFEWHKGWLDEFLDGSKKISSYEYFCELKFLIRRAVYLENLQILDTKFLELISGIFDFIKEKLEDGDEKINYFEKENYNDFSVFLVRSYLELAHKSGWAAVKLLENINVIEATYFRTSAAKRFLRMLKIELAAVVNEFYDMLILQYDREWREVYREDEENFIEETKKIKDFIKNKELKKSNKYIISEKVLSERINVDNKIEYKSFEYEKFINFLWIKQMIYNDTYPKSHFPTNVDYQEKIAAIIKKMKEFFPKEPSEKEPIIQAFFVVTDRRQNPYVLSDSEYVLHNFEAEYQTHKRVDREAIENLEKEIAKLKTAKQDTPINEDELRSNEEALIKIKERYRYYEIITFLNGVTDSHNIASETTAEFQFDKVDAETRIWKDSYNSKNNDIKLNFLNKNWLYLIRLSELEDGEFRTLGLLGFYSKKDLFNKSEALLPKQLLMLLRQDMGKFIKKHHKNDEFSALRQAELTKRFAYLAGHGRQTMLRLAKNDKTEKIAHYILPVMEKLQYLYATHYIKVKDDDNNLYNKAKQIKDRSISEILKLEFSPDMGKVIKTETFNGNITLRDMVKSIYESEDVENKVTIKFKNENINTDYDTLVDISNINVNDFYFDEHIIFFILFEMIINAKKNRWHCIDHSQNRNDYCRNELKIEITTYNNDLIIKVSSTGTFANTGNTEKINKSIPVKRKNENEGLYLISSVLKDITGNKYYDPIKFDRESKNRESSNNNCKYKECCKLQENIFTVTIKPIKK